jgi:type VI protein secretion system component VasK
MNDRPQIITPRRIVARGFVEWFADLANGDPVAWSICCGFILFVAVIAILGAFFLWQRKKAKDAFKKKVAEKRKKEDQEFKASRKTKEI